MEEYEELAAAASPGFLALLKTASLPVVAMSSNSYSPNWPNRLGRGVYIERNAVEPI